MWKRLGLALVLAAVAASQPAAAQVLATSEQLDHERALVEILSRPEMRSATAPVEALYRADPQARTAAGKARIKRAASSIATAAANYALSEDASRPAVIWWVNAPHRWHGIAVPGSGFGIDNPDNVYQGFTVEGGKRYLVHGKMPSAAPVQLHMEVRDSIPGMGEMLVEGGRLLATIQSEQLSIAADGSFTIPVDSDPTAGRSNHLALPQNGIFMVNIRQLLTDWASQAPIELRIERITPDTSAPKLNIQKFATRSAEILDRISRYWLDYDNRFIFTRPANSIASPRQRPGGRGLSTSGHFALAKDEAMVITADALGATSLGVQLTDAWGVAYDYDRRTSSLNNRQATSDGAGTYTFIISAGDPGFENWLDSGGYSSGIVVLRWQGLPAGADPAKAVRTVSVVKLKDLPAMLPAGQLRLSASERQDQRRKRARDYAVRLTR